MVTNTRSQRLAAILALVAGAVMVLGAIPHAFFAWPHFRAALLAAAVDPDVVGAIAAAWRFGSVMMVATGLVVVGQGAWVWRGHAALSARVVGPIGLAWLGYGIVAMVARDGSTHLSAYVVAGTLAMAALALGRRCDGNPRDRGASG
jgi:hypothetical protein